MKLIKKDSGGYSILISIFMIGFLVVLTSGIFSLVLGELNDNRGRSNYLKSFFAAEGALELSLLKIKENGYGYYDKIESTVNNRSIILAKNPLNLSKYKKNRDILLSYDIASKVNTYSGTIEPLSYDIIPLFYLDDLGENKVEKINLNSSSNYENLAWNIVSSDNGISGTGVFSSTTIGNLKTISLGNVNFSTETIENFLGNPSRDNSYLILFNTNSSDIITYDLKSLNNGEFFTKPNIDIFSSAKIGKYKQNLRTNLDNTAYLNILKYSIYSN